ncbi:sulfotransferase 2A1-like isoform X2 [Ambystoma mexicanum]|uniref:sulfotransferase 2A1-like isoform X2 n=1 Tax=Ambystoma mexicanum TaxID=8296 RepID=UPI0037E7166C
MQGGIDRQDLRVEIPPEKFHLIEVITQENVVYEGIKFPQIRNTVDSLNYAQHEFQVRDEDVFNVTYPKSGTTWMQEILTLINSKGDLSQHKLIPSWERVPWVEQTTGRGFLENRPSPRLITSHLQAHLFPKSFFKTKAKVIYTMRNPKDVCVSLYNYCQITKFLECIENFAEFHSVFIKGDVIYGSWFDHVSGWLKMKDQATILLMSYEGMLQDPRGSVLKICKFLGRDLDDAAIDSVVENTSFIKLKNNQMSNYSLLSDEYMHHKKGSFFRKGISGDWKNYFTVAQSEQLDHLFQEKMKDFNLKEKFMWD